MLKQEQETISEIPASQVRVTPEEMAKALAALEARKQQEAHQKATTLTLGEAVQDLALDTTPEELFAEVKRQRDEKANARATAEQQERDKADAFQEAEERRQAALRMAQNAQPVQNFPQQATGWRGGWSGSRNRPKRNRWIGIAVAFFVLPQVFGSVFSGASHIFHSGASHIFSSASHPIVQSLSSLPEGDTATCNTDTLWSIKQGEPSSKTMVTRTDAVDRSSNEDQWEIVKHNGQVYVRVYCLPLSDTQLNTGPSIRLYNGNNVDTLEGEKAQGQTVRLDELGWKNKADRSSNDDWESITVSSVPLDAFADKDKQ